MSLLPRTTLHSDSEHWLHLLFSTMRTGVPRINARFGSQCVFIDCLKEITYLEKQSIFQGFFANFTLLKILYLSYSGRYFINLMDFNSRDTKL
jgi:hypothetical protein